MVRVSALVVVLLWASRAGAQSHEGLSSVERGAAERALAARGLEPELSPEGKIVGKVHIVTLDVFETRWFAWANVLHATTRESVVRRNVLLAPGRPWDTELANETVRILRDVRFHSVVLVLPVKSREPGKVDVLVVTRDVWSLRLNIAFDVPGGILTKLHLGVTENNLLGRRKTVSLIFHMDQGTYGIGPGYSDPSVLGTHWQLDASFRVLFDRETSEHEGSSAKLAAGYPLWNLARRWSVYTRADQFDGVVRSFEGGDLRTYDDPGTAETEAIPYRYRLDALDTETGVIRAFPGAITQHVTLGHALERQRPEVEDEIAAELEEDQLLAFRRDVLPRSQLHSALFVGYAVFTPRFVSLWNFRTFELREDYRAGPHAELRFGVGLHALGSDSQFRRVTAAVGWTWQLCGDDLYQVDGGIDEFIGEDGGRVDRSVYGKLFAMTQPLGGAVRVVVGGELAAYQDELQNRFHVAGGETGLRGYPIGAFKGEARYLGHVELRTVPVRLIGVSHWGGVLFWDAGHATDRVADLRLHHDVGFGLRLLIPAIDSEIFRLDWAFALTEDTGWPGRISFGFLQVF